MIRITYSEEQTALAERIRDDLALAIEAPLPLLIVLVSAASNADPVVQAELARAQAAGERIPAHSGERGRSAAGLGRHV